jgi:outer membrane protein OmpA-like peptidoglycan-associated protein
MNIIKFILTILFISSFCLTGAGQFSEKKIKDKANLYFKNDKFFEALQLYKKYDEVKKKDQAVKLRLGICYFFNNEVDKSIDYLSPLVYHKKKPKAMVYLYLGRAYHAKKEYKKAIKSYKSFLKDSSSSDPNRRAVKDEIQRCAQGLRVKYQKELAVVENLGENVNTRFDEFASVQSPNNPGKLYFSSARIGNLGGLRDEEGKFDDLGGTYSSDIFSITLQNGVWANPKRLGNLLNSPHNDVILDFNEDGSTMLLFKGFDLYSGQILVDSFKPIADKPLYPPRYQGPVLAERGDAAPYFFNDSTLIFSSRIEGGFGGSDLYISQKSRGKWCSPFNLGSTINSAYDEATPFLAEDGRTLYFSSNSLEGIGAFDIYKAIFNDFKKEWGKPKNLGLPVNSPKDDYHFRLNRDGSLGYFSSSRVGGYGGEDLYVAYFKTQNLEQLNSSTPTGFHTLAFKNLEFNSDADYINNNNYSFKGEMGEFEVAPIYYESDGDLLSAINIAQLNKIIGLMRKYPQLKVELTGNSDNQDQDQFSLFFSIKRAEQVARYLIKSGIKPSNILLKGCGSNFPIAKNVFGDIPNLLGQRLNRRIDFKMVNIQRIPINFMVVKPKVEQGMIASKGVYYGNAIKGLSYKVQVAEIKQNYNSKLIVDYPDAMVESSADTRYYKYTIGLYKTFESANYLRKELQRQGITVAEVVPYINGIRLSESEAETQSASYPDLLNFIDSASQN